MGAHYTAKRLKDDGQDISYRAVYKIMQENGLITPSPAKSKRRKWVRFERKHSNSMWHTGWHIMKNLRIKNLNLVAFLDDASRCVTGAFLFPEATSYNSVLALRAAMLKFDKPATILSDNGSCFTSRKRGMPKGSWKPTLFEDELLKKGIGLINSRPYHPQTNGKLERWFRTLEDEMVHYKSLDDYVDYYNKVRFHRSLDFDNCETPWQAFHRKMATKAVRESNPEWAEEDENDWATSFPYNTRP